MTTIGVHVLGFSFSRSLYQARQRIAKLEKVRLTQDQVDNLMRMKRERKQFETEATGQCVNLPMLAFMYRCQV